MNKVTTTMNNTIKTAKNIIRKEIDIKIKNIDKQELGRQSDVVYKKLIALPQYQLSKRISIYLSTDNEINTLSILKNIFDNNKEVFIPMYEGKLMKMVKLKSIQDYENLPITKWNIKQPSVNDVRDDALLTGGLDLIILPGVAFTMSGKRLGHGMGYYDKYINNYIQLKNKKPYLIGLAFNEQIKDDIPTNEQDVNLDLILTER
ncbi:5-formyltetrahydrofolate cyclo-ligase [Aphidius gifuensis]|uniref:5-formyltetrahydrofolate cyclo-ligase n=1 Tax=Aphidius gifuensis TaxID=684658 RepID=UPI001CDD0ECF|nr:5-formyltetrahydrofolate cyclo-ligase [Aphidius gifuensis]